MRWEGVEYVGSARLGCPNPDTVRRVMVSHMGVLRWQLLECAREENGAGCRTREGVYWR